MIKIRSTAKKDFKSIQEIAYATWAETYKKILGKEQLEYMLKKMNSLDSLLIQTDIENHLFLLALENEKPVGFASYQMNHNFKRQTKIHKLYVLPNCQKKGVGKQLLDEIIQVAKDHNETSITLNVNRFNKATEFYLQMGFEITEEVDIEIGEGFLMEDYVMTKNI